MFLYKILLNSIMENFYKQFPASRCAAGLLLIIKKQQQQRHQQYYFVGYEGEEQKEVGKQ
ncbi:MAG TPA: hypothetical protein VI278_08255 [Nitrososphaeraceae archaeon]